MGDLDLHGIELFIGDLGDGKWLSLLWALEGQVSQGDVPLTVVLLVFTAGDGEGQVTVDKRCEECGKGDGRKGKENRTIQKKVNCGSILT